MNYSGLLLAQNAWALMVLRVVLGVIFLSDGLPKIKNLKGEQGSFGLLGFNPGKIIGIAIILLESIGGAFLVLGIFVQLAALLLAIQMIIAALWKIRLGGEVGKDFWFQLILAAATLALATSGAGSFSLGSYLGIFF